MLWNLSWVDMMLGSVGVRLEVASRFKSRSRHIDRGLSIEHEEGTNVSHSLVLSSFSYQMLHLHTAKRMSHHIELGLYSFSFIGSLYLVVELKGILADRIKRWNENGLALRPAMASYVHTVDIVSFLRQSLS